MSVQIFLSVVKFKFKILIFAVHHASNFQLNFRSLQGIQFSNSTSYLCAQLLAIHDRASCLTSLRKRSDSPAIYFFSSLPTVCSPRMRFVDLSVLPIGSFLGASFLGAICHLLSEISSRTQFLAKSPRVRNT